MRELNEIISDMNNWDKKFYSLVKVAIKTIKEEINPKHNDELLDLACDKLINLCIENIQYTNEKTSISDREILLNFFSTSAESTLLMEYIHLKILDLKNYERNRYLKQSSRYTL